MAAKTLRPTVPPTLLERVERMILSLGASEKVKLYKARHLVEMTVARQPDLLERCFGPLGNAEKVHGDRRNVNPQFTQRMKYI